MPQSDNKFSRPGITAVLSAACLTIFMLLLIQPFFDHDFYWHLKTGEWLWQHKTLPLFDPFTVEPQPAPTDRSVFLLSSYWLFQLLLQAFYKIGGFGGIVFFRFVLELLLIYAVYRFIRNKNLLTATVAATGLCQLFATQVPERPQFMSFICMTLLLSTLLRYTADRNRSLLPLAAVLCLTMLAWANMHGGFILGQSLLLLVLLTEGVKFLHPGLTPLTGKQFVTLGTAIAAALLVSLVNPNPLLSFRILFSAGDTSNILYSSNLEYSNLWEYFKERHDQIPFIALGSYMLTLVVWYRSSERTNITWLAILLLFGYMGAVHIRYYPFFLIAATLFALRHLETAATGKTAKAVIAAAFLTVAACSLLDMQRSMNRLARYGWVPASYFPVAVSDFIAANGLQGNIFTTSDWGGYVLWRLGPQRKLFCDSRQLFPDRYLEYLASQDRGGNEYLWKRLLDRFNIQLVILPLLGHDFRPYAMTAALSMDKGWREISRGNNGVAFMRNP